MLFGEFSMINQISMHLFGDTVLDISGSFIKYIYQLHCLLIFLQGLTNFIVVLVELVYAHRFL